MTKEEIGELIAALPQGLDADEFIHRLVNWAVDRERERLLSLSEWCRVCEQRRFAHEQAKKNEAR